MNGRVIILQSGKPGADAQMFRAYLPADTGGYRKPVGVSCSTTGNIKYAIIRCAAKAFQKLNEPAGDLDEIETRVKIENHPQANTWLATIQPKTLPRRNAAEQQHRDECQRLRSENPARRDVQQPRDINELMKASPSNKISCTSRLDCQCVGCVAFWRRIQLAKTSRGIKQLAQELKRAAQ